MEPISRSSIDRRFRTKPANGQDSWCRPVNMSIIRGDGETILGTHRPLISFLVGVKYAYSVIYFKGNEATFLVGFDPKIYIINSPLLPHNDPGCQFDLHY